MLTLSLMVPTLGTFWTDYLKTDFPVFRLPKEIQVVTKKEIGKTISEDIGLTQLKTKEIVQKTFDAIVETLVEEKRIELRNFGVFEVKQRAARKARNPRTGQRVDVPAKFVVTFKPGKEMEERVKQLENEAAAAQHQWTPTETNDQTRPEQVPDSGAVPPTAQNDQTNYGANPESTG